MVLLGPSLNGFGNIPAFDQRITVETLMLRSRATSFFGIHTGMVIKTPPLALFLFRAIRKAVALSCEEPFGSPHVNTPHGVLKPLMPVDLKNLRNLRSPALYFLRLSQGGLSENRPLPLGFLTCEPGQTQWRDNHSSLGPPPNS